MKDELAVLSDQISNRDRALEESRLELADANARLRLAEERYNEVLKAYEERIIALYKQGEHRSIGVIMGSEGLNDALTRLSYMHKISENDRKLISRVKAEEQKLREAREDVERVKMMNFESVDSLNARKAELEAGIADLQKELDALQVRLDAAIAIEQEEASRRLAEEAAALGSPGAGSIVVQSEPPAGMEPTGTVLFGVTSWYGPGFHGNRTANGEIYDMYAFTAAHKTLPFNTWLKVNYDGRSVFVRINDRGPYIGGRFLDLSKASAQALGISGIAFVSAEIYR
ncbi:MAG: septal ring lytic transglycosylase RlpA family protein [Gaiellales bacterium]|nr:MAG: septal ring lytic transglycosylase RlpA family protein [Gaiellales bacterium]